jgi:Protein of unknown function (DUF998)
MWEMLVLQPFSRQSGVQGMDKSMKTPVSDSNGAAGAAVDRHLMVRKILLVCGILSSLLYVAMVTVIGPMRWAGYSLRSQSVSELFAFDAPSRPRLIPLGITYQVLVTAFALGVWISAGRNRWLRVSGAFLFAYGVVGFAAPFSAMHTREYLEKNGPATTESVHKLLAGVTVFLMLLAIAFGAAALGKRFRLYSIATIAVLLTFGALTLPAASNIEKNLPTPWMGLEERINILVFLVWVVVLAIALFRTQSTS